MPAVITIQGADDGKQPKVGDCKEIERKGGCKMESCLVQTDEGPRWRFKKGTMRCPTKKRGR